MTEAWVNDGCREIQAARAAGEHEIAIELARFVEGRGLQGTRLYCVAGSCRERALPGRPWCREHGPRFIARPGAWPTRDAWARIEGRAPMGRPTQISPEQVAEMIQRSEAGERLARIHRDYGISLVHAQDLVRVWRERARRERTQRMIEVMRREPDLSTWALAERFGVSEDAVRSLRHRAGLPPPEPWRAGRRA